MSSIQYFIDGEPVDVVEHVTAAMAAAALRPFGFGGTGYHAKRATSYKAYYAGRWRRVYSTCFSNAGSVWIMVKGQKIFLR
jgi:hypothetical protein